MNHELERILSALSVCCGTYVWILATVAFNVPLLALILLRDLNSVAFTKLTGFYFVCVTLGYYGLILVILTSVAYLMAFPWRRAAVTASTAVLTLTVFYLLVDSQVYSIYHFHVDVFWLRFLLKDPSGLGIPRSTVLALLIALLSITALESALALTARRFLSRRLLVFSFPLVVLFALGISQIIHIAAYERGDMRITAATPHLPFYMPVRSHRHAVLYGDKVPFIERSNLGNRKANGRRTLSYPLSPINLTKPTGQSFPNILIILLESWRYDTMDETVSPQVYGLAQKSTVFRRHFSSGNSTVAGLFGLFYGIYPTYWEAVKANSAQIHNPVLIDVLADRGYDFGIFAESRFERHKIKDTVFAGIDVHNEFAGKDKAEKDAELTRQLIAFLDERSSTTRPFMALAFYKASHFDYSYDEAHARFRPSRKLNLALMGGRKNRELYLNDYRNAVYYDDDLVGQVLAELEAQGRMKDTIVLVTTDHGEEFDDRGSGYWGHGSDYTQYQTRVPLIAYFPDRDPMEVFRISTHLDIAPTLLQSYLGCINPISDYSDGLNLLGDLPVDRPLVIASYFNHAFIFGDDVYESRPLSMKTYKLDDIHRSASEPPLDVLRTMMMRLGRFYSPSPGLSRVNGPLLAGPPIGSQPGK